MRSRGGAPRGIFHRTHILRACSVLLLICILAPFVWQTFSTSRLPPRSYNRGPITGTEFECSTPVPPVSLDNNSFCTGPCKADCFPRVRDICFSANTIKLCSGKGQVASNDERGLGDFSHSRAPLPHYMRFRGERLTVELESAPCDDGWIWIDGLTAVADQRFLPYKKPNPHHETEKLIPALLLSKNFGADMHWFVSPMELSEWAKGFLSAFRMEDEVTYLALPVREADSICFRDAILLSSPTNSLYVPDRRTNQWLRTTVLEHCQLPLKNASWPLGSAVIFDRSSGPRRFGNMPQIREIVSQMLHVPVEYKVGGLGSFCQQVAAVTQADLFVVPHGSQNVPLLFARAGAIVIEVFPFLFHTTALRNFTHAAQVQIYSVLGLLPPGDWKSAVFSIFGWDFCYNSLRWCKNHARRQPIYADLHELEKVLGLIERANGSFA